MGWVLLVLYKALLESGTSAWFPPAVCLHPENSQKVIYSTAPVQALTPTSRVSSALYANIYGSTRRLNNRWLVLCEGPVIRSWWQGHMNRNGAGKPPDNAKHGHPIRLRGHPSSTVWCLANKHLLRRKREPGFLGTGWCSQL